MIVRIWHGRVAAWKARAYRESVMARAIPDCRSVPGNLSLHVPEHTNGNIAHFVTFTFWRDLDSIRAFAGEDAELAKYYPEDPDYLLGFEPGVTRCEVVGAAPLERTLAKQVSGWRVQGSSVE